MRLVFVEKWQDERALRSHFVAATSRQFMKSLQALAEETSGIQMFQAEQLTWQAI